MGFFSSVSPAIHILAGENVCIQVIRPTQASLELASRHSRRMASGVVSTGLKTTFTGTWVGGLEEAGDLARVVGHLFQRLGAVKMLASRDEPDLVIAQDRSFGLSLPNPSAAGMPVMAPVMSGLSLPVVARVMLVQLGRYPLPTSAAAVPSCSACQTVAAASSVMTAAFTAASALRPIAKTPWF